MGPGESRHLPERQSALEERGAPISAQGRDLPQHSAQGGQCVTVLSHDQHSPEESP